MRPLLPQQILWCFVSGLRYGENEYRITIKPQDYRNKNRASGVPVRRRTLCNCACRLCTLIMCSEPLLTAHYHLRNYYITKYKRSNPHHGLLIKIKKSSQLATPETKSGSAMKSFSTEGSRTPVSQIPGKLSNQQLFKAGPVRASSDRLRTGEFRREMLPSTHPAKKL